VLGIIERAGRPAMTMQALLAQRLQAHQREWNHSMNSSAT
jgi:hypothetical protein